MSQNKYLPGRRSIVKLGLAAVCLGWIGYSPTHLHTAAQQISEAQSIESDLTYSLDHLIEVMRLKPSELLHGILIYDSPVLTNSTSFAGNREAVYDWYLNLRDGSQIPTDIRLNDAIGQTLTALEQDLLDQSLKYLPNFRLVEKDEFYQGAGDYYLTLYYEAQAVPILFKIGVSGKEFNNSVTISSVDSFEFKDPYYHSRNGNGFRRAGEHNLDEWNQYMDNADPKLHRTAKISVKSQDEGGNAPDHQLDMLDFDGINLRRRLKNLLVDNEFKILDR